MPLASDGKIPREKTSDLFKSGMSSGVGSSLDRLSEYYIKRAEQLQPIIQIAAGQAVDVIFTSSSPLGTTIVREKIAQERFNARTQSNSGAKELVNLVKSNLEEKKHGF